MIIINAGNSDKKYNDMSNLLTCIVCNECSLYLLSTHYMINSEFLTMHDFMEEYWTKGTVIEIFNGVLQNF